MPMRKLVRVDAQFVRRVRKIFDSGGGTGANRITDAFEGMQPASGESKMGGDKEDIETVYLKK